MKKFDNSNINGKWFNSHEKDPKTGKPYKLGVIKNPETGDSIDLSDYKN